MDRAVESDDGDVQFFPTDCNDGDASGRRDEADHPGRPSCLAACYGLCDAFGDETSCDESSHCRAELSGPVYTQVTDLEHEINGMWTYERRVLKVDGDAVRAVNRRVIAAGAAAGIPVTYPGHAYWPLDEGQGSVSQAAGGQVPLTLTASVTWVPGVRNTGLHFDGVGSYAQTAEPVIDTTRDYTVSAWVTLDALPGNYATAVSQDGRARENPFYLQYGQGSFAFSMPGGVRALEPMTPELGRWYHLVGVRDHASNEVRLYVDGQRVAAIPAGTDGISTGPLSLGRAKFAGQKGDFWAGSIDEVRGFDQALGDAEIASLYSGGRT